MPVEDDATQAAEQRGATAVVPARRDREEAIHTLEALVAELPTAGYAVDGITMRARHAYEQLGWQDGADFFARELLGYEGSPAELPPYRKVDCRRVWFTGHTGAAGRQSSRPDLSLVERLGTFELRTGMSFLVQAAITGTQLRHLTGNTRVIPFTSLGRTEDVTWFEWVVIEPSVVQHLIGQFRNLLHVWIGRAVITLHAGAEATTLWDIFRVEAEELAAKAGVGDDLDSIVQAALTANPSEWQGALLRCRIVVDKLSRYLYQVDGDRYPHLPAAAGQEPMRVDGNNYRNRLVAYMHQKGLNTKDRQLATSHLDWFTGFVDQVNQLGSRGKHEVTQRDVAKGLMHTYLLLSEIAERTDGEPITQLVAVDGSTPTRTA